MYSLVIPPLLPYPPRYLIDPVAFFGALIGAPILFTLLSFWALFIPVFALVLGGPAYLVIGTPILLWYLRRNDGEPSDLGFLAFCIMAVCLALLLLFAAVTGDEQMLVTGCFFFGFGMIFAPAWAYLFGTLYRRFRRDFYAKPRPL